MLNRLGSQVQNPYLLMDRAYEGNETRQLALALGFTPVVPPLSTRVHPWEYDREMYKRRNEIERLFRRLKGFRRISSRFEKLDVIFLGFISFALIFEPPWQDRWRRTVHTKRSASKMSANEMNPRKITSSFSKREKMRRNPFNRNNGHLRTLLVQAGRPHVRQRKEARLVVGRTPLAGPLASRSSPKRVSKSSSLSPPFLTCAIGRPSSLYWLGCRAYRT